MKVDLGKFDLKVWREIAVKATPGPWGPWSGNWPFYVDVRKPSQSLSKHDDTRPTYWRYEDAEFVLNFAPEVVIALLDRIKELENIVNKE
jgi:hypothetical protein